MTINTNATTIYTTTIDMQDTINKSITTRFGRINKNTITNIEDIINRDTTT